MMASDVLTIPSQGQTLYGKRVSSLVKDDVKVYENGTVTGTFKHVTGYTGFNEADPEEQERRFLRCNRKRVESGLPAYPEATEFLEAIRAGIPASSGCALGFDRIVMLLFGAKTLAEVSFPLDLN